MILRTCTKHRTGRSSIDVRASCKTPTSVGGSLSSAYAYCDACPLVSPPTRLKQVMKKYNRLAEAKDK